MVETSVLLTTYPEAFLYRAGGEIELLDLHSNLRRLGVRADIYGAGVQPLAYYNAVLHYSVVPSGLQLLQHVKAAGKKIVLMPSLWWSKEPTASERESVGNFFKMADVVVFRSNSEFENITRYVPVEEKKTLLCRWGVDSCFEYHISGDIFKKVHSLNDYILSLGIIEERKNQLTAIHALRDFPFPLVFIGDYRERKYYEACVKSAPSHFKFLPYMQPKSEMLRSALRGCSAFLEVSLEPAGLSSLEAALSGVPMVISDGPWAEEHFGGLVTRVDPLSPRSIREGIDTAIAEGVSPQLQTETHNKYLFPQSLEPLVRALSLR